MPTSFVLPQRMRDELHKPFGYLISGSYKETTRRLKAIIEERRPVAVVAVGDVVSRNLHGSDIKPKVAIVDNRSKRKKLKAVTLAARLIGPIDNPAGTITQEAIDSISEALKASGESQILIEGEEDLLVIPAVLQAQQGTLVVYGQPCEGIVVVEVTPEKKQEARRILESMEIVRKAK